MGFYAYVFVGVSMYASRVLFVFTQYFVGTVTAILVTEPCCPESLSPTFWQPENRISGNL